MNVTAGGSKYELELPDTSIFKELKIKRNDFPSDFVFGVATSAVQVNLQIKPTNFIFIFIQTMIYVLCHLNELNI